MKTNIVKNVFCDSSTIFMALPTIFLILSDLLMATSGILPVSTEPANRYSVVAVALFSIILLKKRMFLTQLVAIGFVVKAVSLFPDDVVIVDNNQAFLNLTAGYHFQIVCYISILCSGLSWVILEKVLKSSETSLWIRGVQLNLFIVPLSLLMVAINAWSREEPMGIFDNFNIIAWFFVIFRSAQQMMELFVLKITDSMQKCFSFSLAFVIIGIMRNPFTMESNYENVPVKLGTGLLIAGICLYMIMENCFFEQTDEDEQPEESEVEYRETPTDFNESSSKGYQLINSVSIINADYYLKLLENPTGERQP